VTRPAPPAVSIVATPSTVARGGSTTLTWQATTQSRCSARGAWHGPRTARGTERIDGIEAGALFELECEGDGGSGVAKATVQVSRATTRDPPPDSQDQPSTATYDSQTHGLGDAGVLTNALLLLLAALGVPARKRLCH